MVNPLQMPRSSHVEELPIDEHRDKSLGADVQKWVINGACILLEYIYIYII